MTKFTKLYKPKLKSTLYTSVLAYLNLHKNMRTQPTLHYKDVCMQIHIYVVSIDIQFTKCLRCMYRKKPIFLQIVLECSYTFVLGNNLEIISRIHTNPTQTLWLGTVSPFELVMQRLTVIEASLKCIYIFYFTLTLIEIFWRFPTSQ